MLMKTDELGIPRFTNRDLIDMIYSGHVDKCHVVLCDPSNDIEKFNAAWLTQTKNRCIIHTSTTQHRSKLWVWICI